MSKSREESSRRLVPRTIAVALLISTALGICVYTSYEAYKHYYWVYKPKVAAQKIVLTEFDSWMEVVPPEHASTYETVRAVASENHHFPLVYYLIGIWMLHQVRDGKIELEEVQRMEGLPHFLEALDNSDHKVDLFMELLSGWPAMPYSGDAFWELGAPKLNYDEL
jgi:hypothetical protein